MLIASVLKHILGGHQKLSNVEKNLKNSVLKFDFDLVFFKSPACLSEQARPKQKYGIKVQEKGK